MTDYTSSFALQKWAKDDEELRKFDMIAKGLGYGYKVILRPILLRRVSP